MRIIEFYFLVVGIGLLTSCQHEKDKPEVLKKVLSDYFDGIKKKDLNKLNSLTTNDFVLFENGKVWTNDSLVKPTPGVISIKGTWTFSNMKVSVDETSGYIIYYDHGEFILNDTIKIKKDWLESAVFKKVDGQWKLKFLHSTIRK